MPQGASTTITAAFMAQAAAAPDAPALLFRRSTTTYGELDARSNRIARWIRRRGAADGAPLIPFCMPQGPDTIAVALAILKLGGAYVPIDPDLPPPRVRWMLEDTRAACVVTTRALAADLAPVLGGLEHWVELLAIDAEAAAIEAEEASPLGVESEPDALAYVMYTSGSTGRPKGVPVCHRGVTRLVIAPNYIDIRASDCFAQAANVAFDAATFEIWGALLNGARLALLSKDTALSPERIAAAIVDHCVTVMFLTTGLFNQLVGADPAMFGRLRYLLFGGEVASIEEVRRLLRSSSPPARLLHVYGPTECTTFSTFHPVTRAPEPGQALPIGQAISATSCFVVDSEMRLVEEGEGELLIGGAGLARGYLGNAEETAQRYLDNPFGTSAGKLYRTGDIVRRRANGDLVFVGRVDNQVKIRGHRIEPEEIEITLNSHPAVGGAVIVVQSDDVAGTRRLVAYLRPRDDLPLPSLAQLRSYLAERLPTYMVPSAFVRVPSFPLSPTGKVDRRRLAELPGDLMAAKVACLAPRDETEALLADLFTRHLRRSPGEVGVDDDFFELGGHSLLAARIAADVLSTLDVELRISDLIEAPTVAALARVVRGAARPSSRAIPVVERDSDLPLSWWQEQIWLHQQIDPTATYYNEPLDITMPEALDVAAFEHALEVVLERHEALRLRIDVVKGLPRQRIQPHEPLALPVRDLRHLGRERAVSEALRLAAGQARWPFDLAADPPIRFLLVRLGDAHYRLFMTGHHIALDGVAMFQVFFAELEAAYRSLAAGRPPALAPLPFRFRDYVAWDRAREPDPSWAAGIERWRERLSDLSQMALPTDRSPGARRSFAGARERLALPHDLTSRLRDLSRRQGVSLFTTLVAAFKTLLYRYTGEADVAVGTTLATRGVPGVERQVGVFLNTILLRTTLPADGTFLDVLRAVRETCREAFALQDIPFQLVARHATVGTSPDRRIPFQAVIVLEPEIAPSASGWDMGQLEVHTDTSKFDLTLELDERDGRIIGRVEYRTDLFEAATIARMIRHYETLLRGVAEAPDRGIAELPLLDESEHRCLLVDWNDNAVAYQGPALLHALVEAQVDRAPDAPAVHHEDTTLRFRDLDEQGNRLAHRLIALGARPGSVIGVWTDRCAEHLVALLGVLKSGAAYLPIAAEDPADRAGFVLADAGAEIVVCDRARRALLGGRVRTAVAIDDPEECLSGEPATRPRARVSPSDLAYVIYTSGSTGKPKGVMIEHHSIADRTHWAGAALRAVPGEAALHMSSLGFDGAIIPTWWALAHGAAVVVPATARLQDPEYLAGLVRRHRVTSLFTTPALWTFLAEHFARLGVRLEIAMAGGERVSGELIEKLKQIAGRVMNVYGPTETTVYATAWEAPAHRVERPPIGTGIANTPLYVLDGRRRPVPVGVPGELYIGGAGVARGYLGRPDLTERAFFPDPFAAAVGHAGGRMYRTGDIVRRCPSGEIELLGRADGQVKIRGFRVELGEIEAAVRADPAVADSVAVVREAEGSPIKRIVVYVVAAPGRAVDALALRARLKASLPPVMVPAAIVPIGALPTTPSGKVDVRRLPEPAFDVDPQSQRCGPRDVTEKTLHELWSALLGTSAIGVHDDFFALGGDSIMSLQLVAAANDRGLRLSVKDVLDERTIAGMGRRLSTARHAAHDVSLGDPLVPLQPRGSRRPLFLVHPAGGLCMPYSVILGHLDPELPVYGFNDPQFGASRRPLGSIEELAAVYVEAAARAQPQGPYRIGGWSFGALVAYEMARQLMQRGEEVSVLALFEDGAVGRRPEVAASERYLEQETLAFFAANRIDGASPGARWFEDEYRFSHELALRYAPGPFAGGALLVRALDELQRAAADTRRSARELAFLGWEKRISGPIELRVMPGRHMEMFAPERAPVVAAILEDALARSEEGDADVDRIKLLAELQLDAIERRDFARLVRIESLAGARRPRAGERRKASALPTSRFAADEAPLTFPAVAGAAPVVTPRDRVEEVIARIFARTLGSTEVRLDDDFFALGGTSLQAVQLLSQVEQELGARVPVSALVRGASAEQIAAAVRAATAESKSVLIPFQTGGALPPFFCVHPAGGSAFGYRQLAARLGPDQPFYGLEAVQGYEGQSLSSMAETYVRAVLGVAPQGPYLLGGWSFGGLVAFEMARQLEAAGRGVALVALIDSRVWAHPGQAQYLRHMVEDEAALLALAGRHLAHLAGRSFPVGHAHLSARPNGERLAWFLEQLAAHKLLPRSVVEGFVRRFVDDFRRCGEMILGYGPPSPCSADLLLLRATETSAPYEGFPALETPLDQCDDPSYGWATLTRGTVRVRPVDGTHETLVFEPHVASLADVLGAALSARARAEATEVEAGPLVLAARDGAGRAGPCP